MLLSGNGRHRRPRQAPGFVVAAGVTGAGVALPLLGAGAANAAPVEIWDQVAQCASGGDWSIDTGNGRYGGLQFNQVTWESYGGTDFAERPDLADRSQQIAVAERVLADQGPSAWGSCSAAAGLGLDGEAAQDGPDVSVEAGEGLASLPLLGGDPAAEAPSATESTSGADARDAGARQGGSGGKGASTRARGGETDGEKPSRATGANGREGQAERADRAVPNVVGEERSLRDASGDASVGQSGDGVVDATVDAASGDGASGVSPRETGESAPVSPSGGSDGEYVVRPGDSLSLIADDRRLEGGWRDLYAANRDTLGDDPDLILPGQELRLVN